MWLERTGYFRTMSLHRWSLVTVLFHLLPCLQAQVVRNWDPTPTITDTAMVFKDDLDFFLNGYSKQEIAGMRRMVSVWRMNFDKVMQATIEDIQQHSEGDSVPRRFVPFELPVVTGGTYAPHQEPGKVRVFMFGSITNPPARFQLPLWDELQAKLDTGRVRLFMVYGRELHPGDRKVYKRYPSPTTIGERTSYAQEMARTVRIPVLVDGMDDAVFKAYGKAPNAAYVIDADGRMIFRGTWADSRKIEYIVTNLLRWYDEGRPKRFSVR